MSFPILYPKGTSEPSGVGIGVLTDALEVKVTREINGAYELTMRYPVEGIHFGSIGLESVIAAKVPDKENYQLFKIYSISEPIDLSVTIDAEHVSYMTGDIPLQPFTNQVGGIDGILDAMNTIGVPNGIHSPFTFTDTLPRDATIFTLKEPTSMREVMGDSDGMLLSKDFYEKAEWDIDNYNLCLTPGLGTDKRHVHYVYGKNVSDINQDSNLTNMVTGIFPYVHAETDEGKPINVLGDIRYGDGHENFVHERIVATNVESYFTDEEKEAWSKYGDTDIKMPTKAQVNSKAEEAIKDFDFMCKPEITISVSPVDLTGVSGYETVAESLKQVQLGDTITVIFSEYGIEKEARVIKVTYNVLDGCNENIEVGDPSPNLAATLAAIGEKTEVNRAGIVVSKDSILAYVDRTDGRMGSQLRMTEDEIKSTVAQYGGTWNMVPLTGSPSIYGEGWTIQYYNYGDPNTIDMYRNLGPESAGWNYFDEETGYVWTCELHGSEYTWVRKKFARAHEFRYYKNGEYVIEQAYPGQNAYTIRMDSYCESNITQVGSEIKAEVTRAETREQSIIDMTPDQILLQVTNPTDGDRRASIQLSTKNKDGSVHPQGQGYIVLTGTCVFQSDLENAGQTSIDGANIVTGKINANRIDTDRLVAKNLETARDSNNYYMNISNGILKYLNENGTRVYSAGNMRFPIGVDPTSGAILFNLSNYYYIEVMDSGTGATGSTRYMFTGKSYGTILRGYKSDGDWIHYTLPITTDQKAQLIRDYNIVVYDYASPLDEDDDSFNVNQMRTNKIDAKYYNSNNRRIMWKNCRRAMGEGNYNIDYMAATPAYVKFYVDGGEGSDRRWKNSIEPISDVSDAYMKLNPVQYRFNHGVVSDGTENEIHFGLIAQEVNEIYPDCVFHMVNHESSFNNEDLTDAQKQYTPNEYYKLRYEELHALHIAMIKKHEQQIAEMQKKLDELLQNKED